MVEIKGFKLTVILREEKERGYSAQCLELPGCITEGETREEALANIEKPSKDIWRHSLKI